MSQDSGETSHGLPLARVGWLMEAKRQPLSAPGRRFPLQGLRLLGRVDELFDDNPHGNEMNQSQKGLAQFLIPRGNASKLLEIVEEPFDLLTELVEGFIIV